MGGTLGPNGEMIWSFTVPLDEQRRYYAAHPPSALGKLRATAVELPGFVFDGHGEPVEAVFAVACPCGGDAFTVLCHVEDDTVAPPIVLDCDACEELHEIYDRTRHGFDGAVGNTADLERPSDHSITDLEGNDVAPPHQVFVRFEFPSDHLGDPSHADLAAEDLFSWITVVGKDAAGTLETLFDDECA